jgi:hypothetical protein
MWGSEMMAMFDATGFQPNPVAFHPDVQECQPFDCMQFSPEDFQKYMWNMRMMNMMNLQMQWEMQIADDSNIITNLQNLKITVDAREPEAQSPGVQSAGSSTNAAIFEGEVKNHRRKRVTKKSKRTRKPEPAPVPGLFFGRATYESPTTSPSGRPM